MVIDKDNSYFVLGLPPANTKRWVSRRKAAVVLATRAGVISREEGYERYALSPEELAAWDAAFDQHGILGLRITCLQDYRNAALGDRHGDVRSRRRTRSGGAQHQPGPEMR
jgi:Protein of unknown function (DUF1153)